MNWTPPKGTKVTRPWVHVEHKSYAWTSGSNVQETWKKYGWVPPSLSMDPPPPEKQDIKLFKVVGGKR